MLVWLRIVSGVSQGQATQLANRQFVVLGRTIRADVIFKDDPRISSEHCRIENDGTRVHLKDLGSTNGTFLNGHKVREAQLQNGDQIRIGGTEILVDFNGSHLASEMASEARRETPTHPSCNPNNSHLASVPEGTKECEDLLRAETKNSSKLPPIGPVGGTSCLPPTDLHPRVSAIAQSNRGRLDSIESEGNSGLFSSISHRTPSPLPPPAQPNASLPAPPASRISERSPSSDTSAPPRLALRSIELPEPERPAQPARDQLPSIEQLSSASYPSPGVGEADEFSLMGESNRAVPEEDALSPTRRNSPLESIEDSSLFSAPADRILDSSDCSAKATGESLRSDPKGHHAEADISLMPAPKPIDGASPQDFPGEANRASSLSRKPSAVSDEFAIRQASFIAGVPTNAKRFTAAACPNDLTCFHSLPADQLGDFFPSGLVDLFASQSAAVVILHFQKIQLETPLELASVAVPMLDWLPTESAFQFGPVMVPYRALHDLGKVEYIDQLWTHDGCLILLGQDLTSLAEYVQQLVHREIPGLTSKGGIFQFCWPSVLGQLLASQSTEVTQAIMGGVIDAVLLEPTPSAAEWQLFAAERFRRTLEACGCHPLQS